MGDLISGLVIAIDTLIAVVVTAHYMGWIQF